MNQGENQRTDEVDLILPMYCHGCAAPLPENGKCSYCRLIHRPKERNTGPSVKDHTPAKRRYDEYNSSAVFPTTIMTTLHFATSGSR